MPVSRVSLGDTDRNRLYGTERDGLDLLPPDL